MIRHPLICLPMLTVESNPRKESPNRCFRNALKARNDNSILLLSKNDLFLKKKLFFHMGKCWFINSNSFWGVERSSISLCRRSEQAQWFLRELIYSSDIHPQKYNPLNILNLSRFQNIVEYSNIDIDNAH